jgi:tetratricopeptide (TPR) repeat protein
LAILERLRPNSRIVAITLRELGREAFVRSDYEAAQHYLSRCLEINEIVLPHSFAVGEALDALSLNAAKLGDFRAAENYQKRALAISRADVTKLVDRSRQSQQVGPRGSLPP